MSEEGHSIEQEIPKEELCSKVGGNQVPPRFPMSSGVSEQSTAKLTGPTGEGYADLTWFPRHPACDVLGSLSVSQVIEDVPGRCHPHYFKASAAAPL